MWSSHEKRKTRKLQLGASNPCAIESLDATVGFPQSILIDTASNAKMAAKITVTINNSTCKAPARCSLVYLAKVV